MRRHGLELVLLLLVACGTTSGTVEEARGGDEGDGAPPQPSAVERLAASAAGEDMAALATLTGSWRVVVEEVRGDALVPLADGRAEITSALSGRFLEWRTEVELQGEAVRSRGLLGYDRERELFELHWVSELSSSQRIARGRGRAARGGLTLESADLDPETGGVRRARTILRIDDDDRFRMQQDTWDPDLADWRGLALTRYERISPDDGSSSVPTPR